jgi:plasmid maintenance system antidote protein VapI
LARAAGVSAMPVSHLIKGKRPVNGELALRLGAVLGQSPQYWLNLQAASDLVQAKAALGRKLDRLHVLPQTGVNSRSDRMRLPAKGIHDWIVARERHRSTKFRHRRYRLRHSGSAWRQSLAIFGGAPNYGALLPAGFEFLRSLLKPFVNGWH